MAEGAERDGMRSPVIDVDTKSLVMDAKELLEAISLREDPRGDGNVPLVEDVDFRKQENHEDDIIRDALKSGMNLRQYTCEIEKELQAVEDESIQDYVKECQNIARLHYQITSCDSILERMEHMLGTFKTDVGGITKEIQALQRQSVDMNIQLKNREAVRGELGQFIDDIMVQETLIEQIVELPVTEQQFLEDLQILDYKIAFVQEQIIKDAKSCSDVADILERLKYVSIAKIREYQMQTIQSFRKPTVDHRVLQNELLKFRFYYQFLKTHEREIAREIRKVYVDTMSKVDYSYFKLYSNRLMKLQLEVADKDDLLGVEDTARKGFFGTKPALKNRVFFTLGNRDDILTELESPVISPQASPKKDTRLYNFECVFRSQNYALVDNACREYLFLTDFFMTSEARAQQLFDDVSGKTLSMLLKNAKQCVQSCYDSIAVLLCIHIIQRYQILMHKRSVKALDNYWESLLQILWPRFEHVLEMNTQSIEQCDPQKFSNIDMRPHYISRRYAEFSAAILGINESFPSETVFRLLANLQDELENFILRMSAEFISRKDQLVFQINNYDMMLGVILGRTKEDSRESRSFKEHLSTGIQEYVEEVLTPHFGGMIVFCKLCEKYLEKGHEDFLKDEARKVANIIGAFNSGWKKSMDSINADIMQSFTNFKNGANILQASLSQLVQYYHRFQRILTHPSFGTVSARSELLNIHQLMFEAKKFKTKY